MKGGMEMSRTILHDAKIEKPSTNTEGLSDPVVVFTSNKLVLVAWWDANTKWWNCIEANHGEFDKETFGDVLWWHEITFPYGWSYDEGVFS